MLFVVGATVSVSVSAQESTAPPVRGSIVEDRAAKKLLAAGDLRYEADEASKAVEVWQSLIERYPRSRHRFSAHMRLGEHLLRKERAYDKARVHFEQAADETNGDDDQRSVATLKIGVCLYEARNYAQCFKAMRAVIETFPTSDEVNQAYYYIGLGHFQLGHYSRAIQSLEKVGTALAAGDRGVEKVEAGKRLFVRIEDADLAALEDDEPVRVRCRTAAGDEETVECLAVGRNVRLALGSLPTALGKPRPGNGVVEVQGGDRVTATYVDRHTAQREFGVSRDKEIVVVGNARVGILDGAFDDTLGGAVLGKEIHLQVFDADFDRSGDSDELRAAVEVWREKSREKIEAELAALAASGDADSTGDDDDGEPQVDRLERVDRLEVALREVAITRRSLRVKRSDDETPTPEPGTAAPAAPEDPEDPPSSDSNGSDDLDDFASTVEAEAVDDSIHSGVFRVSLLLRKATEGRDDAAVLEALPGDIVRLTFIDELHTGSEARTVTAEARCIEGNIGGVRVTKAEISDEQLRLQTRLKTASALTEIGNRYKEFGLHDNAQAKYEEALQVCEEIVDAARGLGGRILEETYVQLWTIYFAKGDLNLAAAMCQRLQREFPESGFVDQAMLQLGHVSRAAGDYRRAISVYSRLVRMKTSHLRGEAQFGIAECWEALAQKAGKQASTHYERAFQEYKKVFDEFPESGRVGEAVSKMANFYYEKKDYARAIDVFETVLSDHPDARFLDVILFNYGRCLYRMERKREARVKFDQLVAEFPESTLAADAKRISDALVKGGF